MLSLRLSIINSRGDGLVGVEEGDRWGGGVRKLHEIVLVSQEVNQSVSLVATVITYH